MSKKVKQIIMMICPIQLNTVSFAGRVNRHRISKQFEPKPLDINLSKMQLNLIKRTEYEVADFGVYPLIIEKYENEDPSLNISEVTLTCCKKGETSISTVKLTVKDRLKTKEHTYTVFQGNKEKLRDFIDSTKFFDICKMCILNSEKEH